MEMSDFSWQQQKYARPEIYVVTLEIVTFAVVVFPWRLLDAASRSLALEQLRAAAVVFADVADVYVAH